MVWRKKRHRCHAGQLWLRITVMQFTNTYIYTYTSNIYICISWQTYYTLTYNITTYMYAHIYTFYYIHFILIVYTLHYHSIPGCLEYLNSPVCKNPSRTLCEGCRALASRSGPSERLYCWNTHCCWSAAVSIAIHVRAKRARLYMLYMI